MNKADKIKEWSKNISAFNKSGKNKQEWCQENNISRQQFGYWYNYFTKKQSTKWLPVKIQDNIAENISTKVPEEKLLPSSLNIKIGIASIEVTQGFDKKLLLDILTTLKTL